MGSFLSTPKLEKDSEDGSNKQMAWGACSMQGWRKEQEDAHIAHLDLPGDVHVFGVFDGHGGKEVSLYVKEIFAKKLTELQEFKEKRYEDSLRKLFYDLDDLMLNTEGQVGLKQVQQKYGSSEGGMHDVYNRESDNIAMHIGCTAVVVMLTPDKIICANAGDSRSVLLTKGKVVALSEDHKPENRLEKARIEAAGGFVQDDRVNGSLNLSRSLGDFNYKSNKLKDYKGQMVTCDPEIKTFDRKMAEDEILVLACDGIWDCLSNEACVGMMKEFMGKGSSRKAISQNVEEMFDKIVAKDIISSSGVGTDNMTCILVHFKK